MNVNHHVINENVFWLSTQRCLFWEEEKALILSDLHFGKTGHFRKNGIAVPQHIYKEDLYRLLDLVSFYKPKKLIVVGDMFHSKENKELDLFLKWRNDIDYVEIDLIKGNHDILDKEWYAIANINVTNELQVNGFSFIHDINEAKPATLNNNYYFSGHFHPAVMLKGISKQSLRLPCFYFNNQYSILPAFSRFSGVALIEPNISDTVYAIIESGNICRRI
jgi:DNA ligase-associated metallophosphoesterase